MSDRARKENLSGGAKGVRRDRVGQGVEQATRAHTRTMPSGSSSSFRTADYQAPQGAGTQETAPVDEEAMSRLDASASGVSSLRQTVSQDRDRQGGEGSAPIPRRRALAIALVAALAVVLLALGAFFLFRSALRSLSEAPAAGSTLTDSYLALAQTDDQGALAAVYLAYVDSIEGRTELCRLSASTLAGSSGSTGAEGDGQEEQAATLADVWERGGLEDLRATLAELSAVDIPAAVQVSGAQLDAIVDLAQGADTKATPASLAQDLAQGATVGSAATQACLRTLLSTIKEIGPDGYVLLYAPVQQTSDQDQTTEALSSADWLTMVRGMRDSSEDVSL